VARDVQRPLLGEQPAQRGLEAVEGRDRHGQA
jgi:hypothetical protein